MPTSALRNNFLFTIQVINQQVFTEIVFIGVKRAPVIDLGHLIDEVHHPTIILQHKGIDDDVFTGATWEMILGCTGATGFGQLTKSLRAFSPVRSSLASSNSHSVER